MQSQHDTSSTFEFTSRNRRFAFEQTVIMGVVNLTPDSFSDGGNYQNSSQLLQQVEDFIEAGVDIIDVGAESTRPGAMPVSSAEQINRLGQFISAIKKRFNTLVSVDTSDAEVMHFAMNEGADIINDVRALQQPNALEAIAGSDLAVILMHIQGQPDTMQQQPHYDNVVTDIRTFLERRINACIEAGIELNRIIIDPGFGFGKTLQQNLQLLKNLQQVSPSVGKHCPMLVGLSRKSMIENITGAAIDERLPGSLALAIAAVSKGAQIVRVHDVKATIQALQVWNAFTGKR